jgi:hypothetical protein
VKRLEYKSVKYFIDSQMKGRLNGMEFFAMALGLGLGHKRKCVVVRFVLIWR